MSDNDYGVLRRSEAFRRGGDVGQGHLVLLSVIPLFGEPTIMISGPLLRLAPPRVIAHHPPPFCWGPKGHWSRYTY